MNIPGLLTKMKLLSPKAVSEVISDTLGIVILPEDVDRWIGYAKKVGPFLSLGDRKVDDLLPSDIQDLVSGLFGAKLDEGGAANLLATARKMVTDPDETVRDMIVSGKLLNLIGKGTAAVPTSSVIYCPHCDSPIIL